MIELLKGIFSFWPPQINGSSVSIPIRAEILSLCSLPYRHPATATKFQQLFYLARRELLYRRQWWIFHIVAHREVGEAHKRDILIDFNFLPRRWKLAETIMPQAIKGVKFVGTEYQTRYPNLQPGVDIQVDANGFIVAEPASARQFLPKHYLDPIPLQQIQLSKGALTQNPGW